MRSPDAVNKGRPRPKEPGRFHHGDLAEQLVVAATAMVESEGHGALTMRGLAKRLGVSDAALYRHFDSREALLAEVAVRGFLRFVEAQQEAQSGARDAFDSISRFATTYVRFAAANPHWFRLQFSRPTTEGLGLVPDARARLAPAEAAREELLARWRAALPPGDDRVADLYRTVWATAHGLASFVVERVFQLVQTDAERIAAANVGIDLLVGALRAHAGTPPASAPS
ncbi:MAG: putative TetR-family transcriptional regulator [Myxococcales bacterium]